MAKTHGDVIREASQAIAALQVEVANQGRELRFEVERTEQTVTSREFADFRRRSETWSQRWWALAVALAVATTVAFLRRFA